MFLPQVYRVYKHITSKTINSLRSNNYDKHESIQTFNLKNYEIVFEVATMINMRVYKHLTSKTIK